MRKILLLICVVFVLASCVEDKKLLDNIEVVNEKTSDAGKIEKESIIGKREKIILQHYDISEIDNKLLKSSYIGDDLKKSGEMIYLKVLNKTNGGEYEYVKINGEKVKVNDFIVNVEYEIENFHNHYIKIFLSDEGISFLKKYEKKSFAFFLGDYEIVSFWTGKMNDNLLVENVSYNSFNDFNLSQIEKYRMFNSLCISVGAFDKMKSFKELYNKINKNVTIFNNNSFTQKDLNITHTEKKDIIVYIEGMDNSNFSKELASIKQELKFIKEKIVIISNKQLLEILKVFKEGKRGATGVFGDKLNVDISGNDNMNLFYILYHIKKSYYFKKVYFVLDGYEKGDENLREQYIKALKYFKDNGVGEFTNDGNELVLKHLDYYDKDKYPFCELEKEKGLKNLQTKDDIKIIKNKFDKCKKNYNNEDYTIGISVNKSMNIRNSISEGADSDIRIYN